MGATLIIVAQPGFDGGLSLGERGELVDVQALVAEPPEDSMKAFSTGFPGRVKSS